MTREDWPLLLRAIPAAINPIFVHMPPIEAYTALAEAMHDESDLCNANYQLPFAECGAREADIEDAVRVLVGLHKAGWALSRDPAGTAELGL